MNVLKLLYVKPMYICMLSYICYSFFIRFALRLQSTSITGLTKKIKQAKLRKLMERKNGWLFVVVDITDIMREFVAYVFRLQRLLRISCVCVCIKHFNWKFSNNGFNSRLSLIKTKQSVRFLHDDEDGRIIKHMVDVWHQQQNRFKIHVFLNDSGDNLLKIWNICTLSGQFFDSWAPVTLVDADKNKHSVAMYIYHCKIKRKAKIHVKLVLTVWCGR